MELGIGHFRLEFLNETGDEVRRTIMRYRRLLAGEINAKQLEMNLLNQLGVTRGQG
jgi:putative protease